MSETIRTSEVPRLKRLRDRLAAAQFPIETPAVPGRPLSFVDKFTGERRTYTLNHVGVPEELFFRGSSAAVLRSDSAIAFGGTVSPKADAARLAMLLSYEAARSGWLVVSGGVVGVDMHAHLGALDARGNTVAVLANPVSEGLHPYYPRRRSLEEGILATGGLVSEYRDTIRGLSARLLERDRIISALADVFVAVECGADSGTVDTARRAYIQGRRVLAIQWSFLPPPWHEPDSSGATILFREGIADPFPTEPRRSLEEVAAEFRAFIAAA